MNPGALASTGLSFEDVRSLLGQVNVDSPKGSFEGDQFSYTIVSNDQLSEAKDYQNLILTQRHGTPGGLADGRSPTPRNTAPEHTTQSAARNAAHDTARNTVRPAPR